MIVFLILSFLEILAERRQKSISVEFYFATVFVFKHHVSAAYVIDIMNTPTYYGLLSENYTTWR